MAVLQCPARTNPRRQRDGPLGKALDYARPAQYPCAGHIDGNPRTFPSAVLTARPRVRKLSPWAVYTVAKIPRSVESSDHDQIPAGSSARTAAARPPPAARPPAPPGPGGKIRVLPLGDPDHRSPSGQYPAPAGENWATAQACRVHRDSVPTALPAACPTGTCGCSTRTSAAAARLTPSACPPTLPAHLVGPPDPSARLGPAADSESRAHKKRKSRSQWSNMQSARLASSKDSIPATRRSLHPPGNVRRSRAGAGPTAGVDAIPAHSPRPGTSSSCRRIRAGAEPTTGGVTRFHRSGTHGTRPGGGR